MESVWKGGVAIMNAGLLAGAVSDMSRQQTPEEQERRAAWHVASQVARTALPILRDAELVKVPALKASALPQPFASNREAARFAMGAQLPAQPTFFDFRHPSDAGWVMTHPEPIRFDGALAWREGDVLSVMPFWHPLNRDGSVKRDVADALSGGPVMRVVFGHEDDVMDRLSPGTLGGAAEDGELYCWPEMPQGGEHARAADRALRCSLRFLDVLAALDGVPAPARVGGDAASKRDALATGSRVPRAYDL